MENVSFHSNPKERQCQRMFKLLHNCTHLTRLQSEIESCSVVSDPLWHHGLYSPWNSPGQNTGVGSHSLLQGKPPNPGIEPRSPAKQCSKFSNPGFNGMWIEILKMFKMDLEKAEEAEIKLPIPTGSSKKQESVRKAFTSASLTTLKLWVCGSQHTIENS